MSVYKAHSTFGSSSDWNNRPASDTLLDSQTVGPVTSTNAPQAGFDVTSAVQSAKQGATVAFVVRGNEDFHRGS